MSFINDFIKLKIQDLMDVVIIFGAIVAPGFLTIFLFRPDLVSSLDSIKIILFSCSLTIPVLAGNFLLITWLLIKATDTNYDARFSVSATVNIISYCIALFAAYNIGLNFKTYLFILLLVSILVVVVFRLITKYRNRAG